MIWPALGALKMFEKEEEVDDNHFCYTCFPESKNNFIEDWILWIPLIITGQILTRFQCYAFFLHASHRPH